MYSIYVATNKINGKKYVGFTNNFSKRKSKHIRDAELKKNMCQFQCAISKYGKENFVWEIVFCSENKLECLNKEKELIKELNTINFGYNLTTGGDVPEHNEQTKIKIGKKSKECWQNEEYREKQRLSHLGKPSGRKGKKALKPVWNKGLVGVMPDPWNKGKTYSDPYHKETRFAGQKHRAKSVVDQHGNFYRSVNEAARITNTNIGCVTQVLKGKLKQTKGFIFKYCETSRNF